MDSYYAILDDFVREVKRACKHADKEQNGDNTLMDLLATIDTSLGRVKVRRCAGAEKKGGKRAKKESK